MPTYIVTNNDTNETSEIFCSWNELQMFLEENPNYIKEVTAPAIVSGVSGITHRVDGWFTENMQRIAEAHPNSPLADRYGSSKSTAQKKVIETAKKHGLVNKINSHVVPKLKSIYKTT